jgi:hypothetical protein
MNRDDRKVFLWAGLIAVAIVLAAAGVAGAAGLPPGTDCETIRRLVAEHSKVKALAWAIRQGYSVEQIQEARKCLR